MSDRTSIPPPEAPRARASLLDGKPAIAPMSGAAALGWTFLVTFVFEGLVIGAGALWGPGKSDLLVSFACQVVAYSMGLFLILRIYKQARGVREFLAIRGTAWLVFPIALLLGLAITGPADALYNSICARHPTPPDADLVETTFQTATRGHRAIMGLILCGAGPILEELFFRGALYPALRKRAGIVPAILTTAVLFALVHIEWQTFAPIFILGINLALLREFTGSLLVSMLVHGAFNSVAFGNLIIESTGREAITLGPLATVIATLVSMGCLTLIYFVSNKSRAAEMAREADT